VENWYFPTSQGQRLIVLRELGINNLECFIFEKWIPLLNGCIALVSNMVSIL
jgi:hypothetical protein